MNNALSSDMTNTRNKNKIFFINLILLENICFHFLEFISDSLNRQWTTQTNLLDRSW